MAKKICMEHIVGQCRNPMKQSGQAIQQGFECPYCLREDGKDGTGEQLVEPEKAEKVFEILKDKIKE